MLPAVTTRAGTCVAMRYTAGRRVMIDQRTMFLSGQALQGFPLPSRGGLPTLFNLLARSIPMRTPIDLTGKRFGRLVVVKYSHSKNAAFWLCQCDCGNTSVVRSAILNNGSAKSCGCGSLESAVANAAASRMRRKLPFKNTRKLNELYRNMLDRCYDPDNKRYANYGGRGIQVCDEWLTDRLAFYHWANSNGHGVGLQIDRTDVNGNYEPENCRFVDVITQMNNTTRNHFLEWHGSRLTVADWARILGVTSRVLQHRVDRGWSVERTLTQPFRARRV